MNPETYLKEISRAILSNPWMRQALREKEWALRIAREIGYGLKGHPDREIHRAITSSYSTILVKATNLNPPINAREWNQEMLKAAKSI